MNPVSFDFESLGNGACFLTKITLSGAMETLELPGVSPDGETVVGAYQRGLDENAALEGNLASVRTIRIPASYRRIAAAFWHLDGLTAWQVAPGNRCYAAVDGLLYTRDRKTLLSCPVKREGTIHIPEGTKAIGDHTFFACGQIERITVPKSVQRIGRQAFAMTRAIVYLSGDAVKIEEDAFDGDAMGACPSVSGPSHSSAQRFAEAHGIRFLPCGDFPVWDHEGWRNAFEAASAYEDRDDLRRWVWLDTLGVVKNAGYTLPDGRNVTLSLQEITQRGTRFYAQEFHAAYVPVNEPTEVRVVPDDCLDMARAWVDEGLDVCVLNMANQQNPGGGVTIGAGAQEEYLFRCSDYFRSLFRFAPCARLYGLDRAESSYPMNRSFGGIYTPEVTVFRGNEAGGYAYLEKPFRVNMIAVAGICNPKLVYDERGEARISFRQVEQVKNKIRTIFRIAQDNGQRDLVLGALGCGAFQNPPRHVAELFREVLCEDEFDHAFRRVTFAVKTDHHSNGNSNFDVFYRALNGFVPAVNP